MSQLARALNPEAYLRVASTLLLILAIAGFILPSAWSTPTLTLDAGQSIGRTLLATIAFTGTRATGTAPQKRVCLALGVTLLFFAAWGLVPRDELPAEFFTLAYLGTLDSVLHLMLGICGFYVGRPGPGVRATTI